MNLLAIIFIACVSISTALASVKEAISAALVKDEAALPVVDEAISSAVVDETTYTCQEGYELDGVYCRQLIDRIRGCPYGAVGSNDGDRCVVDNKFCSFGHPNTQATVDDRTRRECDEGYTFVTAANRCVKRVDHGSPKAFCESDLTLRDGECFRFQDKRQMCEKDATLSKPGCLSRRIPRGYCGCPQYYKLDATDRDQCIFDEDSPERFCSATYTEDSKSDKCLEVWNPLEVPKPKFGCQKGIEVEGRCEELLINFANVLCPVESSTENTNVTGLQQLTCFEGTVKKTVEETVEKVRCLVTRNVLPELVCPTGSSASSINPTKCKSNVASPADVITATTTTITFADVAADVDSGL